MVIALYFLNFDQDMIRIFSIIWIVYTLPVVYLHGEYYSKNGGQKLEIQDNAIVLHDKNGTVRRYANEDLKKIVVYKSASLDKGGMPLLPIEFYHYAQIVPKQGDDIMVTCLMTPKVEEVVRQIKWVPYERKKRLFASLKFSLRILSDYVRAQSLWLLGTACRER